MRLLALPMQQGSVDLMINGACVRCMQQTAYRYPSQFPPLRSCLACMHQVLHKLPRSLGYLDELLDSINAKATTCITQPIARIKAIVGTATAAPSNPGGALRSKPYPRPPSKELLPISTPASSQIPITASLSAAAATSDPESNSLGAGPSPAIGAAAASNPLPPTKSPESHPLEGL